MPLKNKHKIAHLTTDIVHLAAERDRLRRWLVAALVGWAVTVAVLVVVVVVR